MSDQVKHQTSSSSGTLDPMSLAAIRELLAREPDAPPAPAPQGPAKADQNAAEPDCAARSGPETEPVNGQDTPRPREGAPAKARKTAQAEPRLAARVRATVLGYRPTARHVVLGSIALLVLFRPWLVVGLLVLAVFIVGSVFLILGYDGFWRRAMGLARWHARRSPARSAQLHRRLDNFAVRFDAFLDRFPEGTVDGLYLPDFSDLAEADARHDKALDRRFETLRET